MPKKFILIVAVVACLSFLAGKQYQKQKTTRKFAQQRLLHENPIVVVGPGYQGLENLALRATVTAKASDSSEHFLHDGNYQTRWNARNNDTNTWVEFAWDAPVKVNRVHVTEFRSRIREHSVVHGEAHLPVENLDKLPANSDSSDNHPKNQAAPLEIPDHVLKFKTVETKVLRYLINKTSGESDEPSLWEVELYHDPLAE